jgi:3-dehydroquinate dehydratase-2
LEVATGAHNRVEVLHGVNLDMLGRRPREYYGDLTLNKLEQEIRRFADELGFTVSVFQTNSEAEYVERLHRLNDVADACILNPGAWTHYSWAIHDALEICGLPAVEIHISDIQAREEWRQFSVLDGLVLGKVSGRGADGYRDALAMLKEELQ